MKNRRSLCIGGVNIVAFLAVLLMSYQPVVMAFLAVSTSVPIFIPNAFKCKVTNDCHHSEGLNSRTLLFASDGDDDTNLNEDDGRIQDFENRRMDYVRILQKTYYRSMDDDAGGYDVSTDFDGISSSSSRRTKFDTTTGRMLNLPLWRVSWVETPGRRNCLNVHEGKYTHMFETILSRSPSASGSTSNKEEPLYFGHLYVPGQDYPLKSWQQELEDDTRFDNSILNTFKGGDYINARPAVVGCLMQIVDYCRMDDGRLMILVQAVERFVVDEVVEDKPYAVANVQILLDEEELPWSKSSNLQENTGGSGADNSSMEARRTIDEDTCKYLRGNAVTASFYYHDYEFDKPKLPISDNRNIGNESETYLSKDDVPWISISKLLPFAHYSTDDVSLMTANKKRDSVEESSLATGGGFTGGELPLEERLQNGGILWNPPPLMSSDVVIRRSQDLDNCDSLETLLWLALDDFCRASGFVLPEEVSCLMPPEMDYLDINPKRTLSPEYPKIRRQRRLSYLAPALIENLNVGKGKEMRQVWLNTPSTRARLLGTLERFDHLNNELMGQFN